MQHSSRYFLICLLAGSPPSPPPCPRRKACGWGGGRGLQCSFCFTHAARSLLSVTRPLLLASHTSQPWNSRGQNRPLEWGDPPPQPWDLRAGGGVCPALRALRSQWPGRGRQIGSGGGEKQDWGEGALGRECQSRQDGGVNRKSQKPLAPAVRQWEGKSLWDGRGALLGSYLRTNFLVVGPVSFRGSTPETPRAGPRWGTSGGSAGKPPAGIPQPFSRGSRGRRRPVRPRPGSPG